MSKALIKTQSILLISLLLSACAPESRMNVLILFLDDFGYGDLARNRPQNDSAPMPETPVLDQFHSDSLVFTRHYTESTCSPSRAALLSGRYPSRFGFTANGRGLPPEITTLPEAFVAGGYDTHFIGKWHLGHTTELAYPDQQGFSSWTGFLNQWMLRSEYRPEANNLQRPTYMNPWLRDESGAQRQVQGHLTDILADQAIDYIQLKSNSSAPWFLQLSFYAPHEPVEPAERFLSSHEQSGQGAYLALLEQLDENIGRILSNLESAGAAEDTLVVIVSDNGGTENHYPSNTPFFGFKTTYTEGGLRTPLMIRWPDGTYEGASYHHPVSLMDLYPTLLSIAGVDTGDEQLDGNNLLAYIETNTTIQRPLFWESYVNDHYSFSVLDESHRWRYSEGLLGFDVVMDLSRDFSGGADSVVEEPAIMENLQNDYVPWRDDTHRIQTRWQPMNENGGGILTGDSLQRSPGFGGYTFAIGVRPQADAGTENQLIAFQEDLLEIRLQGDMLLVTVQDIQLTGTLPRDGLCHSIIVTAQFAPRISWLLGNETMASPIQLIIDGTLASEDIDFRELPKPADLMSPTYVGFTPRAGQGNEFAGTLGAPLIYNHRVWLDAERSQPDAENLAQTLCS